MSTTTGQLPTSRWQLVQVRMQGSSWNAQRTIATCSIPSRDSYVHAWKMATGPNRLIREEWATPNDGVIILRQTPGKPHLPFSMTRKDTLSCSAGERHSLQS